jgi:Ca2+-binding RTX toxin-like protein
MPVVACAVVGALLLLGTPNTATAGVGDCGISDESTNPILGTTGDDHIRGTSGDDVILGLGGNDEIRGLAGKDQICTEEGDDTIYPGRGSDYTYAGDGDNEIVERDYSSNIYAGSGDDVVRGRSYFADVGSGNNRTYGADGVVSGNGHDIIIGAAFVQSGAGRDRIDSSDVRNTVEIHAGKGDDFIHGTNAITQEVEEAVEELHGGRGDDRIYGGASGERMWPGPGNDVVNGGTHNGWNAQVIFGRSSRGVSANLSTHRAQGEGIDRLWHIDLIFGTGYGDVLVGSGHGDILFGCGGPDLLKGRSGPDFIQGDSVERGSQCPGRWSSHDRAWGGTGRDTCSAESVRNCEHRDYDPSREDEPSAALTWSRSIFMFRTRG